MFEGFTERQVEVAEASVFVRYAGDGPPVLLLHGHPRTSATWHRVAPLLVERGFRPVCPDLRGYGRSRGPAPRADHAPASKRAMASDLVQLMTALGHERFALVGHDRGSYVALRLALDHAERVSRLALVDSLPISEHLARADADFATRWWHWFFYAQPVRPERAIAADPESWYGGDPEVMGAGNHAEWREAVRNPDVVRAMLEDYRAGLTLDRQHEEADRAAGRQIGCPLLVLWSLRDDLEDLYGDPRVVWRDWATDVRGHGIDSGHHVAEEAPEALATALGDFLPGGSTLDEEPPPEEPPAEGLWGPYDVMGEAFARHAEDSAYNAHYDRPAVLAALGDVRGLRVLDAACGPGLYASVLVEAGASVRGFDASRLMVDLARRRLDGRALFDVARLGERLPYDDEAFDLAVCALAIHYAEDPAAAFRELHRVLRPGGALVLSTQHPTADWLRKGGSYFDRVLETDVWDSPQGPQEVRFWREPLRHLCGAATGAGFVLDLVDEPGPAETMREKYPHDHTRLSREPGFLVLRLRKLPADPGVPQVTNSPERSGPVL